MIDDLTHFVGQLPATAQRVHYLEFLVQGSGEYAIPPDELHPRDIYTRLLELPEFEDIRDGEAAIEWLLKREAKHRHGRTILGTCHLPKVQGDLNPLFQWMLSNLLKRECDYLIVLDMSFWFSVNDRLREILVYHELSHCHHARNREGELRFDHNERPIWDIRGHDIEEFTAVAQKYGAWNTDLELFRDALNAHAEGT